MAGLAGPTRRRTSGGHRARSAGTCHLRSSQRKRSRRSRIRSVGGALVGERRTVPGIEESGRHRSAGPVAVVVAAVRKSHQR